MPPTQHQDRRFGRARAALLALRRDPLDGGDTWAPPSADVCERARCWLIELGLARGTTGGEVVAWLARRGYAVPAELGTLALARPFGALDPLPLDAPGLIAGGLVVPRGPRRWQQVERIALGIDPTALEERRWCSAHELIRIRARLRAEGVPLPPPGA